MLLIIQILTEVTQIRLNVILELIKLVQLN